MNNRFMDYLDEDPVLPPNQTLACISVIPSEDGKMAFKFRGGFPDRASADAYVKRLHSKIPTHQHTPIYVVDIGKWIALPPPSPEELEAAGGSTVYQEEFLQELIKGYRDNRERVDTFFQKRKELIYTEGLSADPEKLPVNTEELPPPEPAFPSASGAT